MKQSNGNGMSFGGTLVTIFIVLKLTGNIDWNWIWVLSPLWISVLICIGFAFIEEWTKQKNQSDGFADKYR